MEGIMFDCFGVLYHGSLGYLRSLADPKHLQELNDLSHRYDSGYINQDTYFEQVGVLLGRPASEIESICQKQHFRIEPMFDLIKRMKPHYKIGLLSNVGRGFIDELFTHEELKLLFDAEVLSNEVGMVKPDVEIFQLAAERLGVAPQKCIMIDDIPSNIAGAERAGMKGIVCKSADQVSQELTQLLESDHA